MENPEVERAVQRQMAALPSAAEAEEAPRHVPAAHAWLRAGNCPECGAPIWFLGVAPANPERPPQHFFTCPCTHLARVKQTEEMRRGIAEQNGKELIHP